MSTSSVSGTNTQNTSAQTTTSTSKNTLGQDAFLKLLMTQLRNQDPLQPTDNTAFIAQLAQFSSLQEVQGISTNLKSYTSSQPILEASNLIGRTVTGKDSDSNTVQGKVSSVRFDSGNVILNVGGTEVTADSLTSIS